MNNTICLAGQILTAIPFLQTVKYFKTLFILTNTLLQCPRKLASNLELLDLSMFQMEHGRMGKTSSWFQPLY